MFVIASHLAPKDLRRLRLRFGEFLEGLKNNGAHSHAAGIGMATIQQAMGHASIQTTAGYCWVSDKQLANAVNVI